MYQPKFLEDSVPVYSSLCCQRKNCQWRVVCMQELCQCRERMNTCLKHHVTRGLLPFLFQLPVSRKPTNTYGRASRFGRRSPRDPPANQLQDRRYLTDDGCVPLSLALGGTPVELIFTFHFFFLATELNFNVLEKLYSSSCFLTLPHQALYFLSHQGAMKEGERELACGAPLCFASTSW